MDFDFSDEQKALAEEVGKVLEREGGIALARKCLDSGEPYSSHLWRLAGELGWCGISIPEEHGGLGMGYFELCLIAEQLGRNLAAVPFASSIYLAAEALLLTGSPEQKARWLPRLASGDAVAAVSLTPGDVSFSADTVRGTVPLLVDGLAAELAILCVNRGGQSAFALIELDQPGVARTALADLDPTRPGCALQLDGARAEPLGEAGKAELLIHRLRSRAAAIMAFEQLGVADASLEQAVAYAKQRYAFGRPIGGFQAIKHKLANVYVANQLARSHAYYAAWALAEDAPDLDTAAAAAHVAAGTASQLAAEETIQVHGGIGFTWEMDCHLFYRRAKHLDLRLGSPVEWKLRLSDAVVRMAAAAA